MFLSGFVELQCGLVGQRPVWIVSALIEFMIQHGSTCRVVLNTFFFVLATIVSDMSSK